MSELFSRCVHLVTKTLADELESQTAKRMRETQETVLVACSGGRDSLALVAATCAAYHGELGSHGSTGDVRVGAVIVNHQLQENSAEVAARAREQCTRVGCDFVRVIDVDVERTRAGLEADARNARYQALIHVAQEENARCILVAHTSDDVAETMLIQLLRNPRFEALTGMDTFTQFDGISLVRPFLELTREDTTAACHELNLEYWDDPTNGDGVPRSEKLPQDFPLRSKLRHDVIPELSRVVGRDIRKLLAQSAQRNREDMDIIENAVDEAFSAIIRVKNGQYEVKIRPLVKFTTAIQRRVIARAIELMDIKPTASMLSDIIQLSELDQKKKLIQLTSALYANKVYDVIQLWKDR
ncbi:tRNA lysidine(34) synthetase TilS [Alloscardovia venturai]|uniref:tRNA(Ile)-lysidine synthase n=1 Tax=Alloscardovia venturai TaxID=1769421 RepID=A0ABW2Y865_9BIFI